VVFRHTVTGAGLGRKRAGRVRVGCRVAELELPGVGGFWVESEWDSQQH